MFGIFQLHLNKICYRDLKSENVMLQDDTVKLIDFNTAKVTNKRTNTMVGTPLKQDPAIRVFKFDKAGYSPYAADIWSSGILLYNILTSYDIVQKDSELDTEIKAQEAIQQAFDVMKRFTISPICVDFLAKILKYHQDCRPEIDAVLDHPFVKTESGEYRGFLESLEQCRTENNEVRKELEVEKRIKRYKEEEFASIEISSHDIAQVTSEYKKLDKERIEL